MLNVRQEPLYVQRERERERTSLEGGDADAILYSVANCLISLPN